MDTRSAFADNYASPVEFVGFQKIARYSREVIVTEKIDGTNAQIYISEGGLFLVGSRTRWITPDNDNHGFARWAYEHMDEIRDQMGPGRHFGEWWGSGIQRGYGLKKGEKRFSLFNVVRWCLYGHAPERVPTGDPRQIKIQDQLPECVGLVPVLWRGPIDELPLQLILSALKADGSRAAPGYLNPEGVVIFHTAGGVAFKKTLGDDGSKGEGKHANHQS